MKFNAQNIRLKLMHGLCEEGELDESINHYFERLVDFFTKTLAQEPHQDLNSVNKAPMLMARLSIHSDAHLQLYKNSIKLLMEAFSKNKVLGFLKDDQCSPSKIIDCVNHSSDKLERSKEIMNFLIESFSKDEISDLLKGIGYYKKLANLLIADLSTDYDNQRDLIIFITHTFSQDEVFEFFNTHEFKQRLSFTIYRSYDNPQSFKKLIDFLIEAFGKDRACKLLKSEVCKQQFVQFINSFHIRSAYDNNCEQSCKDIINFLAEKFSGDRIHEIFDHPELGLPNYWIDPESLKTKQIKGVISKKMPDELKSEIYADEKISPILARITKKDPISTLTFKALSCYIGSIACANPNKAMKEIYEIAFKDMKGVPTQLGRLTLQKISRDLNSSI
jgi:hypothetical protein